MIREGNLIKIKSNLVEELLKLGFNKNEAEELKIFEGTEQMAYEIYDEDGVAWVTIDLCCEVPLLCCEKIKDED